jgi:hypothetical protein
MTRVVFQPVTVTIGRRYTLGRFVLDLFLTVITHGLWLLWLLFKYLRAERLMAGRHRYYGKWHFLYHALMTTLTGGAWLLLPSQRREKALP